MLKIITFLLVEGAVAIGDFRVSFPNWDGFIEDYLDIPKIFSPQHYKSDDLTKYINKDIQFLTNIITQVRNQGQYYQLPNDASEYKPLDYNVKDLGFYDFIVIGAGAGGSIVANRLSEVNHWQVLLLEAGGYSNNITDIPNMYFEVEFTEYNWGFVSTPQEKSCQGMIDKRCPMARGRGIGGTTLINGLVYSRGSSLDFDRWAERVGDSRWSYDNVLPVFKRTERFNYRDVKAPVVPLAHGTKGLLNVEYHLPRSPQFEAWLMAHEELGYPVADYNAGTGLGASPAQINTANGRREDAGTAFILPIIRKRKNLHVLTHSYVTKIIIDDDKVARGVVFVHNGGVFVARVRKEVVLCAGTFQTPQLLMLSGIGPRKHLESVGVKVIQDLEVGSTLRDHACFYGLNFKTNYAEPVRPLEEYVEEFTRGFGPLAAPGNNQGVAFYESQFTKGTGYPDIEIMFIPSNATTELSQRAFRLTNETYEDVWKHTERTKSFLLYIISLHSDSFGTVRLKSNNPFDYPLIDNRFLTDPSGRDLRRIYEGVQIMLRLSRTEAMRKLGTSLQGGPLRACSKHEYQSKAYWYCAIREMTMNIYHPVGTAPMGQSPGEGDVVDAEGKVFGVGGLRVADGSVFPFPLGGHPAAGIVMVGEMVSDFIKNQYY